MKARNSIRQPWLFSALAAFMTVIPGCSEAPEEEPSQNPENLPQVEIKLGEITDKSVETILEWQNAEEVACMLVEDTEEAIVPEATFIFENGQTAKPTEATHSFVFEAKHDTKYIAYAASKKGDKFSEVASINATTLPLLKMLSFVKSDKTSFTYKVEADPEVTYRHCYIESWYFEYALAQQMEVDGDEFDMKVFLWNLLAEYGYDAKGTQEITWTAGDPDPMRDHIACLAPGKKYYALFSLYNETDTSWHGIPEAISFEMEPGGKSSSTVTPEVEACDPTGVRIRMNCDETVKFFFYQFYTKTSADKYLEENGEEGMMNHLFEYGWPAGNTYTDVWNTEPATAYTLLIYGVDANGDEFFTSMDVTTPAPEPSVSVEMKPYERELEGLHTYDTFEVTVKAENIPEIKTDEIMWTMKPMSEILATLDIFGQTLDALIENPEWIGLLGGQPLPEEDAKQLASEGKFTRIFPQLEANTEYFYGIIVPVGEKNGYSVFKLGYASEFTAAEPEVGGESDPEYKEYLGEWTVLGQSTSDWTTHMEYTLRFEELTPNRSFKVYGWGQNEVAQEMPFIARYDPATKKIAIDTPQVLGKKTIDGKEYEIIFEGLFLGSDSQLYINNEHSGAAFTGKISQGHFAMFGEIFNLQGMSYEFKTMAYMGVLDGKYYALPGDEHNNVNFHISRK